MAAIALSPSPNNTIILAGSITPIIDSHLNSWTITASAKVAVNGKTTSFTAGVAKLAYVNSVIWELNISGIWYSLTMVAALTSGLTKTSPLPTVSPNNMVVLAGSTTAIVDSNFNSWIITAGAQIEVNGNVIGFTSGVVEIAYVNGVFWQLNTAGNWYSVAMVNGLATGTAGPTTTSPLPAPPPARTAVPLGLYSAAWSQEANLTSIMGRAPTHSLVYVDQSYTPNGSTSNPGYTWAGEVTYYMADLVPAGVIPVEAWPFGYNGGQGALTGTLVNLFSQIAAGDYDTLIQGNLAAWKAAGFNTLVLRPAWEMNGNWYAWSVTSANIAEFQLAWQHFYTVVHTYAVANGMTINVNWCPNIGDNQADNRITVAELYPGNAYVDSIGIDDYGNQAGSQYTNAQATDTTGLQYLPTTMVNMGIANDKPISGGEIGGNAAEFAQTFVELLTNSGAIIAFFCWWDSNDAVSGQGEWTAASDGLGANTPPAAPTAGTFADYWAAGFGAGGSIKNP